MKQKRGTLKNEAQQSEGVAVISVGDDKSSFASVATSLAEIRKLKGVSGYILRSTTSALIDLTEKDKITPYAMLSAQIHESSIEIANQFNLSNVESVLVEGKNVKVLCMSLGENKIDVFMDKTAAHSWIAKRILL
jgi:predicted regulator of Ras-like GTPase activity (Roadblock/LC7/MglB family)